jgi:BlaI family transcriptional regulator, penicillinase repressor
MARPKATTLTDAELRLMRVLWKQGRATIQEVMDGLDERPAPTYSSVSTILRILEDKGYAAREAAGRKFVYFPLVASQEARSAAVRQLASRFFDSSPKLLALDILEAEGLDAAELERLNRLIADSEIS